MATQRKAFVHHRIVGGETITIREIDTAEQLLYNRAVSNQTLTHLYQSYQWGELKSRYGWKPIRLVVQSGRGPVGGLTLLRRHAGWISFMYSPRGPILDYRNQPLLGKCCPGRSDPSRKAGGRILEN